MTHTIGLCNGAGIIRDLHHGDTGEVYDCPGCPACRREPDEDDGPACMECGRDSGHEPWCERVWT